ncbi:MAG: cobalamin B12-binding domain-containing protein [Thermodesulfobacteriota bacterium]
MLIRSVWTLSISIYPCCAEDRVSSRKTPRILLAKPGLDGHDRGAKVVAHALKNAGFEVIYTGLHQTVEMIVRAAIQEDVDIIGLSIMSGAHIPICEKLLRLLKENDAQDIMVLVGGVIPGHDVPRLKGMGVAEVFPGGSDIDEPAAFIRERLAARMN